MNVRQNTFHKRTRKRELLNCQFILHSVEHAHGVCCVKFKYVFYFFFLNRANAIHKIDCRSASASEKFCIAKSYPATVLRVDDLVSKFSGARSSVNFHEIKIPSVVATRVIFGRMNAISTLSMHVCIPDVIVDDITGIREITVCQDYQDMLGTVVWSIVANNSQANTTPDCPYPLARRKKEKSKKVACIHAHGR